MSSENIKFAQIPVRCSGHPDSLSLRHVHICQCLVTSNFDDLCPHPSHIASPYLSLIVSVFVCYISSMLTFGLSTLSILAFIRNFYADCLSYICSYLSLLGFVHQISSILISELFASPILDIIRYLSIFEDKLRCDLRTCQNEGLLDLHRL